MLATFHETRQVPPFAPASELISKYHFEKYPRSQHVKEDSPALITLELRMHAVV